MTRYFFFLAVFLTTSVLSAQIPENIFLEQPLRGMPTGNLRMDCTASAGNFSLGQFFGQSNSVTRNRVFLCLNDSLRLVHNGAFVFNDPNLATPSGIGYAFYDCPPTITGPTLRDILADPCLNRRDSVIIQGQVRRQTDGMWISRGSRNGNITLSNLGDLQSGFNNGGPVGFFFAPITIDNFARPGFEALPNTTESGPCVNLNADAAIEVVYLSGVSISDIQTSINGNDCIGSFVVRGGMPEYDSTARYTIDIVSDSNPDAQAEILTNGPYFNGDTVRFFVPEAGTYRIIAEDGISCSGEASVDMASCKSVIFSLPLQNARNGDVICLPLYVENFDNLLLTELRIRWDPTVLQFEQTRNRNTSLPGFDAGSINHNPGSDSLTISWFNTNLNLVSLPDSSILLELCFTVIGTIGETSPVAFLPPGPAKGVVGDDVGENIGYLLRDGRVNVSNDILFLNVSVDSIECKGQGNGALIVSVAQGTPPYNVSWTTLPPTNPNSGVVAGGIVPPNTSARIPNLEPGRYEVIVSDNSTPANTLRDTVEIPQPPDLIVRLTATDLSCPGANDGTLNAEILLNSALVTNTTGYRYRWSIPGQTGSSVDSLPPGTYSITVTAPSGCEATNAEPISEPALIVPNAQITAATCTGSGNGSITLRPTGGVAAGGQYTFQWADLATSSTGATSARNNLEGGQYCVTITDDNGCTLTRCFTVQTTKTLRIDATPTDASCFNSCNGQIVAVGSSQGGVRAEPFVFTWSATGSTPPVNNNTSSILSDLCAGEYIVTMRDGDPAGCSVADTITINQPDSLVIDTLTLVNESCLVGNDGSVSVVASGGTGPYQYAWVDSLGTTIATDSFALNLSQGPYTLNVTDANACPATFTIAISAPVPPQITSFASDTVSCPGDSNGQLTIVAQPAGSPITGYSWSNGLSGETITGLAPGTYRVTITAADGCQLVDSAQVIEPLPLMLDGISSSVPSCPGSADGELEIFVSGGTGPYTFNWSNSQTGMLATGLRAGNYEVTVTDANGCPPLLGSSTLPDPPSITVTFMDTVAVSCFEGRTDGRVTASALYSDGAAGIFSFIWSSGEIDSLVSSSTAQQLVANLNSVRVIDSNNCEVIESINIPSPPAIEATPTATDVSCNSLQDGGIRIIASGGVGGFQYLWSTGAALDSVNQLAPGNYTVTITDANNCTLVQTATVGEPAVLMLSVNAGLTRNAGCEGESTGVLAVQVNDTDNINPLGASPFTWSAGIGAPTSPLAEGLAAGTYSVTVTDIRGCQDSLRYEILQPPPIVAAINPVAPPRCFGDATFISIDTIFGGNGTMLFDYTFTVDNSGINFTPDQQATIFAGSHIITIEDAQGCSFVDTIEVFQPDQITVTFDPAEIVVELGDSLTQLQPIITASLPIDSFLWAPGDFLSANNVANPFIVDLRDDRQYTLTVVDENGCQASGEVFVELDRNRNVFVPNAFSPNGDGRNDEFRIFACKGVQQITYARIFDRWGNLVAERKGMAPDCLGGAILWDGFAGNEVVNQGVYVYIVEVEFIDQVSLVYRGDIAVIR
ncbi:MAG: gliding motility-associated C-terminal domain-containing protein [Lewinellaceae bacterium]|nr:gliding motility-associated C-terminal domain-containing protein [Lewinellaceae bacterium]